VNEVTEASLDIRLSQRAVWRRNYQKQVAAEKRRAETAASLGQWRPTDDPCDCETPGLSHNKIEMLNSQTKEWEQMCPIGYYVFCLARLALWGEVEMPTREQYHALIGHEVSHQRGENNE